MTTEPHIKTMSMADYPAIIDMLSKTDGVTLRDADSESATAAYLARNPGLSFVAEQGGHIIGMIMSGHDGRRGYLQHLVVRSAFRGQGIGAALVEACLQSLEKVGIMKSHVFVLKRNSGAQQFWQKRGWQLREDIGVYSCNRSDNVNV